MDGGVMTMQPPPNKQYHHMVRMPNYQRPPLYIPNARTPMPPKGITNAQQSDTGVAGGNPFDGKRMRKAVHRKTIDYNTTVINYLQNRVWQRDFRDSRVIQPDGLYHIELVPPLDMIDDPMNCVTTRFMRQSTNKFRCPIFCLAWTPEGRRLVTGASSGEFTLWNGLTFNFETILQAHDTSVRAMVWSHNDQWMVTGDHIGYIKYWQSNMNNVKMYQGHKEAIRCIRWAEDMMEMHHDSLFADGNSSKKAVISVYDVSYFITMFILYICTVFIQGVYNNFRFLKVLKAYFAFVVISR